ncbi:hypothetical protein [Streptomyces sp. LN785]|uniref:hypothetical protein n=1 Tax=Streptomyces sp. LN785 TaxID=3112983 RepID=UPI0037202C72
MDWELLQQNADVLVPVGLASDEDLVRARTVLLGLQGFYAMYMMHGLFMPDTPGLAALRDLIDSWGMGPFLGHMVSLNPSPRQFAEGLTVCLEPLFDQLYEALMAQLVQDPYIFRIPGDDTGAAGFMETWMSTLREQTPCRAGDRAPLQAVAEERRAVELAGHQQYTASSVPESHHPCSTRRR